VNSSRQRWLARLALAAFGALCLGWLLRLDFAQKISTNVLDLIPPDSGAPELAVVRDLAGSAQARVMLFVLSDPAAPSQPPLAAASRFAAALARSPLFAEAVPLADPGGTPALGRAIFDQRFALLLPSWLGQQERGFAAAGLPPERFSPWLADRAAADLETFLSRPEAMAMQELLSSDPLLLVPRLLQNVQAIGSPTTMAGGQALVWARLAESPLADAGQRPVFAAIEDARATLRAANPGIELRWTGVSRFAAASRARIEAEIKLLNSLSLFAVLAVACLFVRRLWKLLHLVPVIACSLLGAWTVSTLVFPRLHVLVFVIGSLLTGVAVDYGFYIYLQPPRGPGETYGQKLHRLLRPLLASCLTTVIGFSLLLGSDLPLLRQVGVFVSAGLLCALGAAMLYFAQIEQPYLETRRLPIFFRREAGEENRPPKLASSERRRALRWKMILAAGAIALFGFWRLHWRDDVRELDIPAPELHANDEAVRAAFGDSADRSVYLTYGSSLAEARRNLAAFLADRARTEPKVPVASLGLVFPTEEDWRALPARLGRLAGFDADFRAALQRHGFIPDGFEPFFHAWEECQAHPPTGDYATLYASIGTSLNGPLAQLYSPSGPLPWFLTLVGQPDGAAPPPGLHTISLSQLQSLNELFTRYRWSALRLSLLGLALLIASVFAIYPFRRGLRIALIPAGSCFFVFGVFGLCGQTLNLFHLLGAFLGVCLAHNYSIFSSDSAAARTGPPAPVRLSALCAASSFGVLSFSHIPVVHALGLTVALIVLTALAAVELEPAIRGPK
jgi:predicted exporter